jgi:hypothetical protein
MPEPLSANASAKGNDSEAAPTCDGEVDDVNTDDGSTPTETGLTEETDADNETGHPQPAASESAADTPQVPSEQIANAVEPSNTDESDTTGPATT